MGLLPKLIFKSKGTSAWVFFVDVGSVLVADSQTCKEGESHVFPYLVLLFLMVCVALQCSLLRAASVIARRHLESSARTPTSQFVSASGRRSDPTPKKSLVQR